MGGDGCFGVVVEYGRGEAVGYEKGRREEKRESFLKFGRKINHGYFGNLAGLFAAKM